MPKSLWTNASNSFKLLRRTFAGDFKLGVQALKVPPCRKFFYALPSLLAQNLIETTFFLAIADLFPLKPVPI